VTFAHPDGRTIHWSSRRHRKHTSRLSRTDPGRTELLWAPHRASWWIAWLFIAGSACFLLAPLRLFFDAVGATADAWVFFVGSLLFTAAATLQWLETINADPGPGAGNRSFRILSWEPGRIDWWSSAIQLLGTLFFNATTGRALDTAVGSTSYDQSVWRPDALGSVCFLLSGYLAYVEVTGGWLRRSPHTVEGAVVSVNLFGCVAFGVSAVAAYVVPGTSDLVAATLANATTSLGALAFLLGAALMVPEGSADLSRAAA
jgi:hypothetical protein